jgi:hypothetical protein
MGYFHKSHDIKAKQTAKRRTNLSVKQVTRTSQLSLAVILNRIKILAKQQL